MRRNNDNLMQKITQIKCKSDGFQNDKRNIDVIELTRLFTY